MVTFFGSEPFCVTVGKKIASNVMMVFSRHFSFSSMVSLPVLQDPCLRSYT